MMDPPLHLCIVDVSGSRKCSLPTSLTADRTQVFVYTEDAEGHSMSLMALRQTGYLVRFGQSVSFKLGLNSEQYSEDKM